MTLITLPSNPKPLNFVDFRVVENVKYGLVPKDELKETIETIAKEEWDEEDFRMFGDDLYKSNWELEEVDVDKINIREDLMNDPEFIKSLNLRVNIHKKLQVDKVAIPPLILRGSDLLIFDGYARLHTLKELGIKKCLAYVGRRV